MDTEKPNGGKDTRALLIQAGLEELNEYGIAHFSSRRVAKKCGVSSAAPYKHFKDVDAFIVAILENIIEKYDTRLENVLKTYADCDTGRQLVEVALDYIRFLTEYPEFRRVIMQNYRFSDQKFQDLWRNITIQLYRVAARYSRDVNMSPVMRKRKTFMIRSIIYGAALFFDQGTMPCSEESMDMVKAMLEREFDLP